MAIVKESDAIAGVMVIEPQIFTDARGFFLESWREEWIPGAPKMIQANRADRQQGTLVGLHYHRFQADYWYVPFGRAFVALHDLREGSPTDGSSLTLEIGEHDHRGIYIPPGVAHGFYAMTDLTITYLVDGYYNPSDELGVLWSDPALRITWPPGERVLSARDEGNPSRADIPAEIRPVFAPRGAM